jgi:hypothetical protein
MNYGTDSRPDVFGRNLRFALHPDYSAGVEVEVKTVLSCHMATMRCESATGPKGSRHWSASHLGGADSIQSSLAHRVHALLDGRAADFDEAVSGFILYRRLHEQSRRGSRRGEDLSVARAPKTFWCISLYDVNARGLIDKKQLQ